METSAPLIVFWLLVSPLVLAVIDLATTGSGRR